MGLKWISYIVTCDGVKRLYWGNLLQALICTNGFDKNPHCAIEERALFPINHVAGLDILLVVIVRHHDDLLLWAPFKKGTTPTLGTVLKPFHKLCLGVRRAEMLKNFHNL